MKLKTHEQLKDGHQCKVGGSTNAGKSGHITITVIQNNGVRL